MKSCFSVFVILISFFCAGSLYSLDIYLVEPVLVSSDDQQDISGMLMGDLPKSVDLYDVLNSIKVIHAHSDSSVRSLIDAGSLAMKDSLNFLLYGTIQTSSSWCEARLSLYELETDSVRTVFYSKVSSDRAYSLADELGRKLTEYLYGEFGIEDRLPIKKSYGYMEVAFNPGYWMVLSPQWSDNLLGYFNGAVTGKVALSEPRLHFDGNEMYPRFGLSIDYALGRNRIGVEEYYYHSIQLGLPLELVLHLKQKHMFGISVTPAYQLDFLNQQRKYGDLFSAASGAFALKAGLLYSFSPGSGDFSFGLNNQIDITFYEDILISYKPSMVLSYKFLHFKD